MAHQAFAYPIRTELQIVPHFGMLFVLYYVFKVWLDVLVEPHHIIHTYIGYPKGFHQPKFHRVDMLYRDGTTSAFTDIRDSGSVETCRHYGRWYLSYSVNVVCPCIEFYSYTPIHLVVV